MRRAAWALALTIVAVAPARAGEREFRDQRKAFEAAIEALPPLDAAPEVLAEGSKKLQDALDGMFAASVESAVEYVIKDHLGEGYLEVKQRVLRKLGALDDPRGVKALLRDYKDAKVEQALVLTPVVARIAGEEATQALARHLRARDAQLKLAAVRGLGVRGAQAADEVAKLRLLLKDESLTLRWAAAKALEAIGGALPEGFAEPKLDALGIPDKLWSDRVAVLIDATREAGEVAFADPTVEGEKKPVVSAYGLVGQQWRAGLQAQDPEGLPQLALARFGRSTDFHQRGYARARRPKELLDLAQWFDREPRERDREVGDALEAALRLDPRPDEVYLFLAGLPAGRKALDPLEVVARLESLTFGAPVKVHVTAFVLEPATPPVGEQGKAALATAQESLRSFASKLAAVTGGRATVIELSRPGEGAAATPETTTPEVEPLPVDLSKPIATRDFRAVKERWDALLAAEAPNEGQLGQLEQIAACPEPKVGELVVEALSWSHPAHVGAVAKGAARNEAKEVREAVRTALAGEKDPARQLLLLRAYGGAPGQDVTDGLVDLLASLSPDAQRLAWSLLSERPDTELAAAKTLKRAARDLTGVASYFASIALSRASGSPSPSNSGLSTGGAQLLPSRFVTRGAAFLVDTHKDMDEVFQTFPAPPAEEGKQPKAAPPPATRLQAVQHELKRALAAVQTGASSANVIQLSGRALARRVTLLDRKQEEAAASYVDGLKTGSHRDVWGALQQALEDPDVEVIHLLVCGPPLRSATDAELRELVAQANRPRGVPIEVVVVAGPTLEGQAEAAQADFLASMERIYKPLAEDSGGSYMIRREVGGLDGK